MRIETTERIVKVFIDEKHRKSFPLFMSETVNLIPAIEIIKMSKRNEIDR